MALDFITVTIIWMTLFAVVGGILMCGDPDNDDVCGRANYFLQATLPDALLCVCEPRARSGAATRVVPCAVAWRAVASTVLPLLSLLTHTCAALAFSMPCARVVSARLPCVPATRRSSCFTKIGGRPVLNCLGKVREYFCWRPNPIVQILYLVLVVGGFGLFIVEGYPFLPNQYMAGYHRITGTICMGICLLTFVLASGTGPGTVNKDTIDTFDVYPYDDVLYVKRDCETCESRKVARSKHCRVCDICVSRFDHHCIWLNQCVGERNYRWFLSFLLMHAATLLYGGVAIISILWSEVTEKGLLNAVFVHRATGQKVPASYRVVFQYLMFHHGTLMGLLMMCAIMGTVLLGFWAYHMNLVRKNTPTNESFKWSSVTSEWWRLKSRWQHLNKQKEAAKATALKQVGKDSDQALRDLGLNVADGADLCTLPAEPPPMPENRYDHGFLYNLWEVLYPRSLRDKDDDTRVAILRPPIKGTRAAEIRAMRGGLGARPVHASDDEDGDGERDAPAATGKGENGARAAGKGVEAAASNGATGGGAARKRPSKAKGKKGKQKF